MVNEINKVNILGEKLPNAFQGGAGIDGEGIKSCYKNCIPQVKKCDTCFSPFSLPYSFVTLG